VAVKAAVYARVSTDDKGQDPETQLLQLREYCRNNDLEILGNI
jgi:DNA invertase Pin-like site-specific DNA recombinase